MSVWEDVVGQESAVAAFTAAARPPAKPPSSARRTPPVSPPRGRETGERAPRRLQRPGSP